MVPHLTTALNGPLLELERHILDARSDIEHWFRVQWQDNTAPFYASVDLRNAGFKVAPVDTNLFPGGFNNLNPDFLPLCVQATMAAIERICPDATRILLIPENHTRNTFYLQNVSALAYILEQAGLVVHISRITDDEGPLTLDLPGGGQLQMTPAHRAGRRLLADGFDPCAILLNNDLSGGVPEILCGLEQTILPPLEAGWVNRSKAEHFEMYSQVAANFAQLVDIDPWLIDPYFDRCANVDFKERQGEDCLGDNVADLLRRIGAKYREYRLDTQPFVVVKADAGTYGMAIMTVRDAAELRGLNRRQRNKMAVGKEGTPVQRVMIQEGVPTFENINGAVAEPVVYMIDHFVVGGFYRVHTGRGTDENLNSPGMHFVPLAFDTSCSMPDPSARPDATPNRFYSYGVIARLALLAAAAEIRQLRNPRPASTPPDP